MGEKIMGDDYIHTEYGYEQLLKMLIMDQLSYDWDATNDEEHTHWNAFDTRSSIEDSGRWHEIIDGSVPVYTYAAIRTWLNLGMPDAKEEYGMDNSSTIIEQVMAGIYMWADQCVGENFESWHDEFVNGKNQVNEEDA
jgi:hypothetical protein